MTRLVVAAAAAFVLSQTAPAQGLADALDDFRDRQYAKGQTVGCQLRMARAVVDEDFTGARAIAEDCRRFEAEPGAS